MLKIAFLLFSAASLTVSAFNNPVIPNENNPDPGVILYNGEYYLVSTSNGWNTVDKF